MNTARRNSTDVLIRSEIAGTIVAIPITMEEIT